LIPAEIMYPSAALHADNEDTLRQASPLYAKNEELKEFPPVLFHVGENEVLLDDTLRMADRIANLSSNHVEVVLWKQLFHVFHLSAGGLVEADEALKSMGRYLHNRLSEK
jgi:monoterpene epsilon-lactone hydrolase